MNLDKIDFEIIGILFNDARMPFKEVAQRLGIGTDTVFRRYRKLKEQGIILGSTIVLNSRACGFRGVIGTLLKVNSGTSVLAVRAELDKIRQIYYIGYMWGDYDFYFECYFRDPEEIFDLVRQLRRIKGILAIDPLIYSIEEWPLPGAFPVDFLAQKFGVQWKSGSPWMPTNPEEISPKKADSK
jgi:Lrp/AsnC family transcriptional regulator for asnA, asnC and gidA